MIKIEDVLFAVANLIEKKSDEIDLGDLIVELLEEAKNFDAQDLIDEVSELTDKVDDLIDEAVKEALEGE